ncbi:putative manganese lipoxygenase [Rosellinia necatrix]|uniref:Manganese lipoxygenase n=1 Tax=Rosellinia necatrix TaxID=77044 RepID=A0A1W2TWK2_ROSNE|nr:putative manganese lipoxygenase [Rosellinia necatrix]
MVSLIFLCWVVVPAAALPLTRSRLSPFRLYDQSPLNSQLPVNPPEQRFLLPIEDPDPFSRRREVEYRRAGFLYGPSLLGNSSYFPTGILGDAIVQQHQEQWYKNAGWLVETVGGETAAALAAVERAGGIKTLSDYHLLYDGQWQGSVPTGIAPGELTNFTSDLLFAMERLSTNPYSIRRLHPTRDALPFELDAEIAMALTGSQITKLHKKGLLFFVDHSYQKDYPTTEGRYVAGCQAYFYLDVRSTQFLPLAIKTNVGSDLIYTPLDDENDWLLAKAMFNQNDLFHGQIFHLANSHAVAEIVHQAALRSMSGSHPVLALLDRLMHQAYAIRPVGETVLFNEGGFFDRSFAVNSQAVRQFATDFYPTVAGAFTPNYFEEELRRRGLINSTDGPELPHLPFYEDGSRILPVIRRFVQSYVDAYYESDAMLAYDWELQAWIEEANGPAEVIDFPPAPLTRVETLVDIITHIAWLGGVSHHVLNAGTPVATAGVLPLHPAALYAPPPTEKGVVADLLPFLPDARASIEQIALLARFNRPQLVDSRETLLHMFNHEALLGHGPGSLVFANERFMADMRAISDDINEKTFDEAGLCQGMPFVWRAMDPGQIPFFLSV